ncbi:MAG: DUF4870 domain-containing protein [Armatimonadetes bacterium]|jgi:uncharacterized Tic20 family protein|nr:DUF4870 domain-containing protein [Armatimonadota bacterium]
MSVQTPAPQLTAQEERTWGMLCHLLAFSGLIIPFGSFLGPLVVWLMKKDLSQFVNQQGKASLNFQLSCLIYGIVGALLTFLVIGAFVLIALGIFWLVEVVMASIAAKDGRAHKYPLTFTFFN